MSPATTSGIVETAAKFRALSADLKAEGSASMTLATTMVKQAVKTYPPPRPTRYVRTGYYGQNVTDSAPIEQGTKVVGYVTSAAPYSIYLRGQPDGSYRQAWMHVGFWQPLADLIDDYRDKITSLVNDRIVALIRQAFGG